MAQEVREFPKKSPNKSANDAYLKIHENFLNQNYAEVDQLANSYLADGTAKPNAEDVLYLQALSLLKLGRGNEARIKFGALENSFTSTDRKASASASIADSYFYENDFEKATKAYQETLKKYPNSDQTAYISYKLRELSARSDKPMDAANPVPTVNQEPFFTVQVGSFSKARNANGLVHKLARRSYDVFVEKDPASGMYRVRVGKFQLKTDAMAMESRLNKEGYPTKIYP